MFNELTHSRSDALSTHSDAYLGDRITGIFTVYKKHNLDARLVGSLGRAASLNTRQPQYYRPDGTLRDLDISIVGNVDQEALTAVQEEIAKIANPFGVDINARRFPLIGHNYSIRYRDITLPIDESVVEPHTGFLGDVPVPTFDKNTLFHIHSLYISMRQKDFRGCLGYLRKMRNDPSVLPEELFEPFHDLIDLKKQRYPIDRCIRNFEFAYKRFMPEPARKALRPFFGPRKIKFVSKI